MEKNKTPDKPERDNSGRFLPGNTIGKLPKAKLWSIKELEEAIIEVELEGDPYTGEKRDLLKHFVKRAFKDDRVLAELIGKKIPKISRTELDSVGSPYNLFVTQFLDVDLPPDLPKEIKEKIEEYRKKIATKKQGE